MPLQRHNQFWQSLEEGAGKGAQSASQSLHARMKVALPYG